MLTLTIKKKWYNMILSGEKKEEYRAMTKYYESRFMNLWRGSLIGGEAERKIALRNGYLSTSPTMIVTVTLDIGPGRSEWGAEPGKEYYRLHIKKKEQI